MIKGVVVVHKGVTICLPKPNRHHHCIAYAVNVLGLRPPISSDSGFYLESGKFLNRRDALVYAKEQGQIINPDAHTQLYSEDIW